MSFFFLSLKQFYIFYLKFFTFVIYLFLKCFATPYSSRINTYVFKNYIFKRYLLSVGKFNVKQVIRRLVLDFSTVTLQLCYNLLILFGLISKKKTTRLKTHQLFTIPWGSVLSPGSTGAATVWFVASMWVASGAEKSHH